MTGINTGEAGCPRQEFADKALERISRVGSESDIAEVRASYLYSMEECGRLCMARGICLAINQGSDVEVELIRGHVDVFKTGSTILSDHIDLHDGDTYTAPHPIIAAVND
ncbi:MAG: hypothetical protein H6799_02245 [Candidatus Nomurabacteria bacterium]|nr:MAG: hypothetical protein H6799_02245 [Candidatus Nomurabacteria bacterium]HRV76401.1 hypothetical protein [Candidatus Saccharimonadales bacterium]